MKNILLFLIFIPIISISCNNLENTQTKEKPEDDILISEAIEDTENPLAKINDKEIYKKDMKTRSLDETIDDEILLIEAKNSGIMEKYKDLDPLRQEVKAILELRTDFLVNKYVEYKPSEEEIIEYYNSRPEKYTYLTLTQIEVLGDEKVAANVRKEAKKIKPFKNLEKLESMFKDEAKLVKVDIIGQNLLAKFQDVLAPKVGYVSNVVEENKFKHKIYVVTKIDKIDVSNFKNAIRHNLIAKDKEKQFDKMIEEYKQKNNIEVTVYN